MIIGIDGNEANVDKRVGISQYAFELLWQFSRFIHSASLGFDPSTPGLGRRRLDSTSLGQNLKFRIYLKESPRNDLPEESKEWQYRVVGPKKFWTQIGLPLDLFLHKPRPDVFFSPTHYAPRFSPIPTVISIMDLSYVYYPQLFRKSDLYQLQNWTSYSVKKARKIFTISKASKNDIIKVYGLPKNRVVVTYPGVKFEIRNSKFETSSKSKMQNLQLLKDKYHINGDYVLFVGTLQPRKNIVRLIDALSKVILERSSAKQNEAIESSKERDPIGCFAPSRMTDGLCLVIVGKKGWLYEEILEAPKKYGVENSVRFLDFVPNEDLSSLYQNALCFVLPSLYEGFGLPVLEAMKNGCPVITSNVSSLPEAGGDAALYVDPLDVNDIASKIKMVIGNENLRKELIEKGKKQVVKFSWEETARETLKVLEDVASK